MKRIALPVLTALALTACATSPLGRSQFLLMPADQMDQMGVAAYDQMKTEQKISTNSQQKRYVQCVADAVTAESGSDEQWEVTLFDDPAANAFALPGGKIGVYTGLLKVAKTQDQLAAVLGHEVGHVLAQHSNERMSIQYATETGTQLLAALGLGTQVGVTLPFSRKHESEADIIGLQMMARAGFDPRQSVQLWKNMAAASNGSPPELLSTHPSSGTRIEDLEASMPEALPLYQQARAAGKRPNCG